MKRLLFTLIFLVGLFAFSWPGANSYALSSSVTTVQSAHHATYRNADYDDYYYYRSPYYAYYGAPYYYSGPGFYINTPFFGFSFP